MITTYRGHKHLRFKNGCILSIFNGFGSYSENYFNFEIVDKSIIRTKDCEIMILDKDENFITRHVLKCNDDVKGYVDKKKLKKIIKKARKYK